MDKKELILKLFEIDAIKFGEFKLKSGIISPIYLDLRVTVSYPDVMKIIVDTMTDAAKDLKYDIVAGIPYTALPICAVYSVQNNIPMIYYRKELKGYGTDRKIEGSFQEGQTCLIIDDLITNGESKFEAIKPIEDAKLKVKDLLVLVDREQGGPKLLADKGYNMISVITMTEILETLKAENKMDDDLYNKVQQFLKDNQF